VLDPELPHNRHEFERLKRLQLWGIPIAMGTALLLMVLAILLVPNSVKDVGQIALLGPLIGYGLFCVYAEARKLLIFLRDLRERERP
jgi:hypothetical protein